jgi:hypothetical protein
MVPPIIRNRRFPPSTKLKSQSRPGTASGATSVLASADSQPHPQQEAPLQPQFVLPINTTPIPLQPKIWTNLSSPVIAFPSSVLKVTWHLHNPTLQTWSPPIILSMLLCKSSPASAMFGAWDPDDGNNNTGTAISGDQVLIRTKHDLDVHEERYEYLTETVEDAVVSGETLEVTAELGVPSELGRYWGCFKVLRHGKKDFYCSFVYVPSSFSRRVEN